jgi:hypothetical protein
MTTLARLAGLGLGLIGGNRPVQNCCVTDDFSAVRPDYAAGSASSD